MPGTANSNAVGPVIQTAMPPPLPPPLGDPPSYSPPVPPTISSCGLPGIRFFESYYWQFIVSNLNTSTITNLNRIASGRSVTYTLNDATEATLTVPSANKLVNIPYTDTDPKVDEGVRCLIGFRHEGTGDWTCRFAGLIMQASDTVSGDVAKTSITAWDPWRYLDMLPIFNIFDDVSGVIYEPSNKQRLTSESTLVATVGDMIIDQLAYGIVVYSSPDTGVYNGLFIDWGQVSGGAFYNGTIEAIPLPYVFARSNGTTIGQWLRDITAEGLCDIVLKPVWDPVNRPGILCELSIYAKAGSVKYDTSFAWDTFPRTATGIDRLVDGTQRANNVQLYQSRGGPPVPLKLDMASLAKFRTYYKSQYFPGQGGYVENLENLATAQLLLRTTGVETITVSPTPERAKVPLLDYNCGDTVRVAISNRLRKSLDATYRVLQIPIDISDEGVEQVQQLTLKKFLPSDYIGPFFGPKTKVVAGTGTKVQTSLTRRSPQSNLLGP